MPTMWSLKGKTKCGRAYWKTQCGVVFLNQLVERCNSYSNFLYNILFTIIHEELHLFLKFQLGKHGNSEKMINAMTVKLIDEITDTETAKALYDAFYPVRDTVESKQ